MINKNFQNITSAIFVAIIFTHCNITGRSQYTSEFTYGGYIVFDSKLFYDIDSNELPINPVHGNDSVFLSVHRRMFIKGHHIIDINKNANFAEGKYIRTDTISYEFYNCGIQKYASFETLSPDSRINRKGSMRDAGGGFSNTPDFDPMNSVNDSAWQVTDTVINGDFIGVVNFIIRDGDDSTDIELKKRGKFWVKYEIKNFPLQLSYILSAKLRNGFVYKMQLPGPDGKSVMVTSFDYQPAKLNDSLERVFEKWSALLVKE